MNKIDIKSLSFTQLEREFSHRNLPKYRATQVFDWLQNKGVSSFDEMTNLPNQLRELLNEEFLIKGCHIEKRLISRLDETVKYLFSLYDGECVESVLMKYKYGYTICVSTQVGCKMGCRFCASTLNGCVRNLSSSEILSQIHTAQKDRNIRISHVVLMGMGEPLDNFENVLNFLELLNDPKGLHISLRNVSVSTCGIVPRIKELETKGMGITLSVSLHAPNDMLRNQIMPVNRKWGVDELLDACRSYASHTGRRISFEYTLIKDFNDSDACAAELANRLKGMLAHVNLIPVNPVEEHAFRKSDKQKIETFINILTRNGISATVRRTLGADINASCGQLRKQNRDVSSKKEVSD